MNNRSRRSGCRLLTCRFRTFGTVSRNRSGSLARRRATLGSEPTHRLSSGNEFLYPPGHGRASSPFHTARRPGSLRPQAKRGATSLFSCRSAAMSPSSYRACFWPVIAPTGVADGARGVQKHDRVLRPASASRLVSKDNHFDVPCQIAGRVRDQSEQTAQEQVPERKDHGPNLENEGRSYEYAASSGDRWFLCPSRSPAPLSGTPLRRSR